MADPTSTRPDLPGGENAKSQSALEVAAQAHEPEVTMADTVSLLDIAIVLAKHKRLVLGLPFAAAVVAAMIVMIVPNTYTATAKILPPQQSQSNAAALLGHLGVLGAGAGSALGLKNPNDVFVAMLKSRTVADRLIEKFDLKRVYDLDLMVDTRKRLELNTAITSGKDGVIKIEVDDHDPARAAALANAYVDELERITLRLAVTEAGQRRVFFEKHLQQARHDLTGAEIELRKFQEATGLIDPAGQASLTVSAAAALRAQITAKEVQLGTLRAFATEQNADLVRAEQELASLRMQLAKMQRAAGSERGDVLVSIGKAPGVSIEYVKKYRDVKYFETLYELLAKQYELARIDEAKNATVIQVLDEAVPPERKSRPKRRLITLLSLIGAGVVAVLIALVLEANDRVRRSAATAARLAELRTHLSVRRFL
jgi:uncharacterized protein involved in exopolysaccharide biosynthesis